MRESIVPQPLVNEFGFSPDPEGFVKEEEFLAAVLALPSANRIQNLLDRFTNEFPTRYTEQVLLQIDSAGNFEEVPEGSFPEIDKRIISGSKLVEERLP